MSRAFYIPPQTQNFNTVGNSAELVDILVATLLSLLDRRHRCQRRCCSRISFHEPNHVSFNKITTEKYVKCDEKRKSCKISRIVKFIPFFLYFIQFNSQVDEDDRSAIR